MMRSFILFVFTLAASTGAVAQQGEGYLVKPLPEQWNNGEYFDQESPSITAPIYSP